MVKKFNNASLQSGVTLIELMVAVTISLVLLAGLTTLFVSTSRSNSEMAKTNYLIEDGRIATQLLSDDLVHAGFWGGYLPHFDDLTYASVPRDLPTAIPNPCQAFNTWDTGYTLNVLGIAVQATDALPTGTGCLSPLTQRAGTDVLIVRHVDTCVPGVGNCDADAAGKLYFQYPSCEQEKNETAQSGSFNSITLDPLASSTSNAYNGAMIHTTGGVGADQYRTVSTYGGGNYQATVDSNWTTTPDNTTTYAIEFLLGTSGYPLHKRNCTTVAEKRRFISNIYYISDTVQNGVTVPTLMRSQLDLLSGTMAQQAPVPMVDGVESLRVVLGIDDKSKSGTQLVTADYQSAVAWSDPTAHTTASNRGDGAPDRFIRCTTSSPCAVMDLVNVVAVKLYMLTRNKEATPGYVENKVYCLGEPLDDGSCAAGDSVGPFNDGFKRHVFTTSIRLTNVSGRRDTP